MKVIFVDDQAANHLACKPPETKRSDWQLVGTAYSQQEALKLIEQKKPDFVVLPPQLTISWLKRLQEADKGAIPTLVVKTHQGIQSIAIDQILYFEADQKYVMIYHKQGECLINETLNELAERLSTDFVRVHRKWLVAKQQIMSVIKEHDHRVFVKLAFGAKRLPVSRRNVAMVRKLLKVKQH